MKILIFSFCLSTLSLYAEALSYDTLISLKDQQLKDALYLITKKGHHKLASKKDDAYKIARKYMFGQLYLEQTSNGPIIEDVYCHKIFDKSNGVAVDRIPDSTVLNCEHTWPQTFFQTTESVILQVADLHHLYPSDAQTNNLRDHFKFGEVTTVELSYCDGAYLGKDSINNTTVFEPPSSHKGNVARALFYFSVRYKAPISDVEEQHLRQWHQDDPADQDELHKNDLIEQIQGNRNPFIDRPELVRQISDF